MPYSSIRKVAAASCSPPYYPERDNEYRRDYCPGNYRAYLSLHQTPHFMKLIAVDDVVG